MDYEREMSGGGHDHATLRERLARVERDLYHVERRLQDKWVTADLRLCELERDNRLPSVSAGTKLILALLVPLAVLLLTGSLEKAKLAATAVSGGGF